MDIHREADVGEVLDQPHLIPGLGFRQLLRTGVGLAQRVGAGAAVAVVDAADPEVAVDVDPPGVPPGRVAHLRPAVVDQVLALGCGVVERVVGAVGVDAGHDEDIQIVDQLPGVRMRVVVVEQPHGRLHDHQRRLALPGVLLGVDEDARLRAVAVLADAERPDDEGLTADVFRGVEVVRQLYRALRGDQAQAGVAAVVESRDRQAVVGVDGPDHVVGGAGDVAGRVGGGRHDHGPGLLVEGHRQRLVRPGRFRDQDRQVVAALVTPGFRVPHHSTGGHGARHAHGLAAVAVGPVRQFDDLGQVGEGGGQRFEAVIEFGGIHVVVHKAGLQAVEGEGRAARRPRLRGHGVLAAEAADHPHRRRRLVDPGVQAVIHVLAGVDEALHGADQVAGVGVVHGQRDAGRGALAAERLHVEPGSAGRLVHVGPQHLHPLAGQGLRQRAGAGAGGRRLDPRQRHAGSHHHEPVPLKLLQLFDGQDGREQQFPVGAVLDAVHVVAGIDQVQQRLYRRRRQAVHLHCRRVDDDRLVIGSRYEATAAGCRPRHRRAQEQRHRHEPGQPTGPKASRTKPPYGRPSHGCRLPEVDWQAGSPAGTPGHACWRAASQRR